MLQPHGAALGPRRIFFCAANRNQCLEAAESTNAAAACAEIDLVLREYLVQSIPSQPAPSKLRETSMPKIMKGRFLKFAKVASSISLGMICHKGPRKICADLLDQLAEEGAGGAALADGLAAHDLRDAGILLAG